MAKIQFAKKQLFCGVKKKNTTIKLCDINEGIVVCGLPIVSIEIKGKTCYFLLDTGAQNNGVSDGSPEAMAGFQPSKYVQQHIGFDGHAKFTPLGSLTYELAGNSFEEQVMVIPGNTFSGMGQEAGIQISGLLGMPFMVKHNCVLDFEKGIVSATITEENDNNENEVKAA